MVGMNLEKKVSYAKKQLKWRLVVTLFASERWVSQYCQFCRFSPILSILLIWGKASERARQGQARQWQARQARGSEASEASKARASEKRSSKARASEARGGEGKQRPGGLW